MTLLHIWQRIPLYPSLSSFRLHTSRNWCENSRGLKLVLGRSRRQCDSRRPPECREALRWFRCCWSPPAMRPRSWYHTLFCQLKNSIQRFLHCKLLICFQGGRQRRRDGQSVPVRRLLFHSRRRQNVHLGETYNRPRLVLYFIIFTYKAFSTF